MTHNTQRAALENANCTDLDRSGQIRTELCRSVQNRRDGERRRWGSAKSKETRMSVYEIFFAKSFGECEMCIFAFEHRKVPTLLL